MDTFGGRLAFVMGTKHIGANELARIGGYSQGYGSRLSRGYAVMPRPDRCKAMAEALGVSVMWLMYGDGPMEVGGPAPAAANDISERLAALEGAVRRLGSEPPPPMPMRAERKRTSSGSMLAVQPPTPPRRRPRP